MRNKQWLHERVKLYGEFKWVTYFCLPLDSAYPYSSLFIFRCHLHKFLCVIHTHFWVLSSLLYTAYPRMFANFQALLCACVCVSSLVFVYFWVLPLLIIVCPPWPSLNIILNQFSASFLFMAHFFLSLLILV